jgi:hypothetical protein
MPSVVVVVLSGLSGHAAAAWVTACSRCLGGDWQLGDRSCWWGLSARRGLRERDVHCDQDCTCGSCRSDITAFSPPNYRPVQNLRCPSGRHCRPVQVRAAAGDRALARSGTPRGMAQMVASAKRRAAAPIVKIVSLI